MLQLQTPQGIAKSPPRELHLSTLTSRCREEGVAFQSPEAGWGRGELVYPQDYGVGSVIHIKAKMVTIKGRCLAWERIGLDEGRKREDLKKGLGRRRAQPKPKPQPLKNQERDW